MVFEYTTTERLVQISDGNNAPSLPPYESIDPGSIPSVETRSETARARAEPLQNPMATNNQKSGASSVARALDEQTSIKDWPVQPRKLRDRTVLSVLFNICQALVTLAPAAFIVLAVLAAKLDGQRVENNGLGRNVKVITKLGPTIFPIVFAAVAGKSLKTIARYHAERGMQLGILELLLASQTVWGAFESQVLLRNFTAIGAHLFLLWCLSPLGGQGSLRILETRAAYDSSMGGQIVYLPTGAMLTNMTDSVFAQADAATGLAAMNSLYSANLLSPVPIKLSGQDIWGNVKVPNLETISGVDLSDEGWGTVPSLSSPDNYTSLTGLPISGLVNKDEILQDFNFHYAYMELQCPTLSNVSMNDGSWIDDLGLLWSSSNGTTALHNRAEGTQTSFFLDTNTPVSNSREYALFYDQNTTTLANDALQEPRNIVYGSEYEVPNSQDHRGVFALAVRNCTVTQRYVEAHTRCNSDDCTVVAIRPSHEYRNRNPNLTPLEDFATGLNLMKNMPLATGNLHVGDAAATELYIRGADMPFGRSSADQPAMLNISNEAFTAKFQLLLNTYFQLSLAPLAYPATLPGPSDSVWDLSRIYSSDGGVDDELPFVPLRANTNVTTQFEVYKCNYIWFSLLLVSSVILLMLGSTGTALGHVCHAPDMVGFFSSFTYNNPYMEIPPGGESLGAMERARLLKNVRVKIGDARVDDEVGHVVFATLHRADTVGDLNAAKRYR